MSMAARYFYRWPPERTERPQCLGVRGNHRCEQPAEGALLDAALCSFGGYCQECADRTIALAAQRASPARAQHA